MIFEFYRQAEDTDLCSVLFYICLLSVNMSFDGQNARSHDVEKPLPDSYRPSRLPVSFAQLFVRRLWRLPHSFAIRRESSLILGIGADYAEDEQ
jgi:hypothetical protein